MTIRSALLACLALIVLAPFSSGQSGPLLQGGGSPRLKAAGQTFALTIPVGAPSTSTAFGLTAHAVYSDVKSTLILLEDGKKRMAFLTSAFRLEHPELQDASRAMISQAFGIAPGDVVINSAHNHSIPRVDVAPNAESKNPKFEISRALGREYLAKLRAAIDALPAALEPVVIKWGVAQEDRITYNRRGRRPDGKVYFIREEDRVLLPPDYKGTIDKDAVVVMFTGKKGPVACLTWYTGHPVTVYDPENPVVFGEWPQVACEKLSAHLNGVPVGFLQGCCGDINSKYMFHGTEAQSREFGGFLGDAFIRAAKSAKTSVRDGFNIRMQTVDVPLGPLPDRASLEKDLAEIDDFHKRAKAGDQNTLYCVGLNFPTELEPPYRAWLVESVRRWYAWALEQHKQGKADQVDKAVPLDIVVARIGDVGFAGMPAETFVRTGFKIKRETNLPCVLASGYTGKMHGYIPDATAVDDRDYMGGNFRNRSVFHPPYRAPGADAMAEAAVKTLNEFAR